MKITKLLAIAVLIALMSCSPTMTKIWTKENYKGKAFEKILVVAITKHNTKAGQVFEDAVVQELKKKGITATNSTNVLPESLRNGNLSDEQIEENVRKENYDGILVAWLADVQTKQITLSNPDGYRSEVSNYRSYINNGIQFDYAPDDVRVETTYVLETKLFDAKISGAEEAALWSGQSTLTEPESFYAGAKEYASLLVKTLTNTGIIKAPK
ncbi:hypothetical protein [Maribellus sediminis]|uniref:hypothetical protein n=1 Tax=Maribellus sediminis TaxID=2696285 RepID=UPI0014322A7C|nr:hypothetical protein [Maribellus sediminis]